MTLQLITFPTRYSFFAQSNRKQDFNSTAILTSYWAELFLSSSRIKYILKSYLNTSTHAHVLKYMNTWKNTDITGYVHYYENVLLKYQRNCLMNRLSTYSYKDTSILHLDCMIYMVSTGRQYTVGTSSIEIKHIPRKNRKRNRIIQETIEIETEEVNWSVDRYRLLDASLAMKLNISIIV